MKGVAADHPHAVIGLFDFDKDGLAAYKLDRNFVEVEIGGVRVKRGMHGQSYTACLPAPDFRQECRDHQNLPIEFLFRDEHLMTEVNGEQLTLKRKKASTMVGDKKIECELDDVTHFKDVGAGKTEFADIIAPTFEADAFSSFEAVFTLIEDMIADSQRGN